MRAVVITQPGGPDDLTSVAHESNARGLHLMHELMDVVGIVLQPLG